ncbi:fructose-6-phosphate aldolase [Candidatus Woesearchaeota archaeon]|nr:MAG: fructose-6-phosphate aldolase [Candidatus Woesearchaeota archaeon]
MEIFLDTGNIEEIQKAAEIGILDGVTTNPTLVAKEGISFEALIKKIARIVTKHNPRAIVNAEVISTDAKGMLKEASKLSKLHKNVVIKIPLIPEGIKAVAHLSKRKIRTNVTLCFSANQALLAAKAGATYISPFVGRLDDVGSRGLELVEEIRAIYDNYNYKTKLLVASIRSPDHVLKSALIGADVCTMPYKIFEKMFNHPLTDKGLEKFLDDWKAYQKKKR